MEDADRLIEIPFEVARHDHGLRLDVFLCRRIPRMSRSLAARLVRRGRVRKEPFEGILRPSIKVAFQDRVILKRKPLVEAPVDDVQIPVLFDDGSVVAVNKPGNVVVHPTASAYHRTVIRILRDRLHAPELDLAHRIDKETSGLLLLARTFEAASSLKTQFADRKVEKSYLAVVQGRPRQDRFVVDVPLRLATSVSNVVMEVHGSGGPAFTEVVVLARGADASLVEARPKTGRQHQIRVHLLHAGHPLVGDKLYLADEQFFMDALAGAFTEAEIVAKVGHGRQALHAHAASFTHPRTGERMTLQAPLTPDLQDLCARLGVWPPVGDGHRAAG